MAQFTSTGVIPKDLSEYKTLLEQRFRDAFGPELAVDPETPQGSLIGIMALSLAEIDESLVNLANAFSVEHATGQQLDDLASLLHVHRLPPTLSTVQATITGTAGSVLLPGSKARTQAGDEFQTLVPHTIPESNTLTISMQSTYTGAIPAPAGTLTRILSSISGWETITNPADATLGTDRETDAAFRARYKLLTDDPGVSTKDNLVSELIKAGAENVRVAVNATASADTVQGVTIPAYSILCILHTANQGNHFAAPINLAKPLGVPLQGAQSHDGAKWDYAVPTPFKVLLTTTLQDDFPGAGLAQIKSNLVAYVKANLGIGQGIDLRRLQSPLHAVPGHTTSAFSVTDADDDPLPATPNLKTLYTLAEADISITLSA